MTNNRTENLRKLADLVECVQFTQLSENRYLLECTCFTATIEFTETGITETGDEGNFTYRDLQEMADTWLTGGDIQLKF